MGCIDFIKTLWSHRRIIAARNAEIALLKDAASGHTGSIAEVHRQYDALLESVTNERAAFKSRDDSSSVEIRRLNDAVESKKHESAILKGYNDDLRGSNDLLRQNVERLESEKRLQEVEIEALKKHTIDQKVGLGKLAEFIRRRHRPDNLPERLNGIKHQRT